MDDLGSLEVVVLIAACVAAVAMIIRSSLRRKGDMGINLAKVVCPECGREQPRMRTPRSFRQFMYGGFTCAGCGAELDKWGKVISNSR